MRIKGLDGLRAVAFLLVFFFHAGLFPIGWVGVQLFFVLSGFLISGILLDMKNVLSGSAYFIKFYGRRFLRIFPLYYLYLLIIWLVAAWLSSIDFRTKYMDLFHQQLPYALTYVYDFYMTSNLFERTNDLLTHFWSLAVEEQFYLFWPFLILLIPRGKEKPVFLLVVAFSIAFRALIMFWPGFSAYFSLRPVPSQVVYGLPFSHMEAFALGALLNVVKLPRPRLQLIALLIAIPVVGLASEWLATGSWKNVYNLGYSLFMPDALKPIWGYTVINYLFALLIFGVMREGWLVRFLDSRLMRYLGTISYGLYVYHFPILWFTVSVWGVPDPWIHFLLTSAALVLTTLAASLSYRFFEKPIMDLKDRWFVVDTERRFQPDGGAGR
jgi:peptidoglycan/LPS O-acetylase OafA/YrhL